MAYFSPKRELNKLTNAHNNLTYAIGRLERLIAPSLKDFPEDGFSIFYQYSDGFVLEVMSENAPLMPCLKIIQEYGYLTYQEYKDLCI